MFMEWMLVAGSLVPGPHGLRGGGPVLRDPNAFLLLGFLAPEKDPSKSRRIGNLPSATVEVTAVSEREAEAVRSFTRWITPTLQAAALRGYDGRESVQMLAEFMAQDPSRPKPPTVERFHYNVFSPAPPIRVSR